MKDRDELRDRVLAPRSSLADAAWTCALLAIVSCGIFSPLAILLSLVALRTPPRTRAWQALGLSLLAASILVAGAVVMSRR